MRRNPERRGQLLDAAIEVLAREGSRGLTFRAVDGEARVPAGTASNYFASRDDLLVQVGARFFERLQPDVATLAAMTEGPRSRARVTQLLQGTIARVTEFRSGFLALIELRLEAVRRPELRTMLTATVRRDIDTNIAQHEAAGLPGDADAVLLLYLALNWLILEQITLPGLFSDLPAADLVASIVAQVVPATPIDPESTVDS
ncbi:MAG TPA: TetR family transcriptional regulator [Jiangellaceae bacterium]